MNQETDLYNLIEFAVNETEMQDILLGPIAEFVQANHHKSELQQIPAFSTLHNFLKNGTSMVREKDKARLVARFYADEKLLRCYYDQLNFQDQQLFSLFTWEGVVSYEAAQAIYKTDLFEYRDKQNRFVYIKQAFSRLKPFLHWYPYGIAPGYIKTLTEDIAFRKVCFSMPHFLRRAFSVILEMPKAGELVPITIAKHWLIFNFEAAVYEELPHVISYLQQDIIKINDKGILNIPSLKSAQKKLQLKTFPNDCGYIKLMMLAGFTRRPTKETTIEITPKVIGEVFLNTKRISFRMLEPLIFPYTGLRKVHNVFCNGPAYDSILNIPKTLPPGQWVTLDNIQRNASCNLVGLSLLSEGIIHELQPNFSNLTAFQYTRSHNIEKQKIITRQAITSVLLIAASLGLVELAYDPANKDLFPDNPKDMHEGSFSACRLTALGEHILLGRSDYTAPAAARPTTCEWDTEKQCLKVIGNFRLIADRLRHWTSEFATDNALHLDVEKIIKSCQDKEDLLNSISKFHQSLTVPMPEDWKRQLMQLVYNSQQVRPLLLTQVYKLSPYDKQLHRLVIQDEVLRKLIIKGENYTIIVECINHDPFIKRMAELGYVLETPSTYRLKDIHFVGRTASENELLTDFDELIENRKN